MSRIGFYFGEVKNPQARICRPNFRHIFRARHREKTLSGVIPSSRQIVKLSDDEIVTRLTEVRASGAGRLKCF